MCAIAAAPGFIAAGASAGTIAATSSCCCRCTPVPAAAAAAIVPAAKAAPTSATPSAALPRIVSEGVMQQALPRAKGVVQLAHAAENDHRRVRIQRCIGQLLRGERAAPPVADLR
jgi:uncharacterized membrane protein